MTSSPVSRSLATDAQGRSLGTRSSIAGDLAALGVCPGDVVCAHVSLSRIGYVCGAGQTVIAALTDAVGADGTVVMPAFSGEMSDPAIWRRPPVPEEWIEIIRRETPPFDPRLTPTRQMGVVAELFRTYPGVLRSNHPHSSFCARGVAAERIVADHSLAFRFGPASPLGRLVGLGGKVLLMGAESDRATFVYLAQYLAGIGEEIDKSIPLPDGAGGVVWRDFRDIAVSNSLVSTGVEYLVANGWARSGRVGDAPSILIDVRSGLERLLAWGWKTAGVPHTVVRAPTALPACWQDWL